MSTEAKADNQAAVDLGDVRQEAFLGIYRFLQGGGDPSSEELVTAAEGQVVKEVGLIVGEGMTRAIQGAVQQARSDYAAGRYRVTPPRSYWSRLRSEAEHRTPRERFRLCLLDLGIKQAPEEIGRAYIEQVYGKGGTLAPSLQGDVDKFRFLVTLPLARDASSAEVEETPFHRQVAAALGSIEDLCRLHPWIKTFLAGIRSQVFAAKGCPLEHRRHAAQHSAAQRERRDRGTSREARPGATSHSGSRRVTSRSAGGGDPPGDDSAGEPEAGRARRPGLLGETYEPSIGAVAA